MKKFILFISLLGIFILPSAQAGLLVEPLIGYNFNYKIDDDKGHGRAFGGRLGYQNLGLQLGIDYLNSTIEIKDSSEDFKSNEWAAFVGYQFPLFFRVYAGYIFSADGELGSLEAKEGSGTKLGVGFTGLPFVAINFEYRSGKFEKINSTSIDTDFSSFLISLSVPLNF
jgi:hypothetical protein